MASIIKKLTVRKNNKEKEVKKDEINKDERDVISIVNKLVFIANESINKDKIKHLKNKEVVQWILQDTSFFPNNSKEKTKKATTEKNRIEENKWGAKITGKNKQWTNKFGEDICKELFILLGKDIKNATKKSCSEGEKEKRYQPDFETDDYVIEAKTETYFTEGTASEKILGVPFKYADVPELYGKMLKIVCIGGAEQMCVEEYGILSDRMITRQKQKFIDFYKENRIEYIGASQIIKQIIEENDILFSK